MTTHNIHLRCPEDIKRALECAAPGTLQDFILKAALEAALENPQVKARYPAIEAPWEQVKRLPRWIRKRNGVTLPATVATKLVEAGYENLRSVRAAHATGESWALGILELEQLGMWLS